MSKKYKIYAEHEIEHQALEQFFSAMKMDYVVQGALMADVHTGYSIPIGAVVATKGVVVPAWVGYDKGCGMCAIMTTFTKDIIDELKYIIHESLVQGIPTGKRKHSNSRMTMLSIPGELTNMGKKVFEKRNGRRQAGTLGGGNHFIEIGYDEDNIVWIVIHSGSRGAGHGLATEYMKLASNSDKAKEGHYGISVKSGLGQDYLNDMRWMLDYALDNRIRLLNEIIKVINKHTPGETLTDTLINKTHNHVEYHEGMGVYIHRKGATQAYEGMMGVIPGNMKQGTFIVRGKGNAESLWSSSHGAGRVLSRSKAKRDLKLEAFEEDMVGIAANVSAKTLDESRGAYKDIHEVMGMQKEQVDVVNHITPIINVKDE